MSEMKKVNVKSVKGFVLQGDLMSIVRVEPKEGTKGDPSNKLEVLVDKKDGAHNFINVKDYSFYPFQLGPVALMVYPSAWSMEGKVGISYRLGGIVNMDEKQK